MWLSGLRYWIKAPFSSGGVGLNSSATRWLIYLLFAEMRPKDKYQSNIVTVGEYARWRLHSSSISNPSCGVLLFLGISIQENKNRTEGLDKTLLEMRLSQDAMPNGGERCSSSCPLEARILDNQLRKLAYHSNAVRQSENHTTPNLNS